MAVNFRLQLDRRRWSLFERRDSEKQTDKTEQLEKVIIMSSQCPAYSPEELASFRAVFEEAVDAFSPMMLTTSNRLQVAQNILARAATGERDQSELGLAAFANVKRSRYGSGVP